MNKSNNQSESKWVKLLLLVVGISLGLNAIQFIKRTEVFPSKKELITENKNLNQEINKQYNELNKYKGISKKIDKTIDIGAAKIAEKEKQIEKLIREKKWNDKAFKKVSFQLDSIREQYLDVIDSLLVTRESIKFINSKIASQEEVISKLNNKIGLGSLLIGDDLLVRAIKKSNREAKQYTALAKRTSEIEVCINILENKISKSGDRNIYFVITSPDAKVLIHGEGESIKFKHPDYETLAECSKVEKASYKNQKINLCSTIKSATKLPIGLYVVEVFTDENKIGMTTFSLK
ncbi:MAG: hypothetical protein JEZ09_15845 [Salinivirgaceae bacterium]|nr:hypothetical protein [Salinivirgaceae bacterium]